MPVQAVFFDLDETLLDDTSSYNLSMTRCCEELQQGYPSFSFETLFETYRTVAQAHWLEVQADVLSGRLEGEYVRLESWRRALRACGCDNEGLAARALSSYQAHRRSSYQLFSDAANTIATLAGTTPMAIITNGSVVTQREKIDCLRLTSGFHPIVVSAEVGFAKPDPAIFLHAARVLGVNPSEVWHVGDNLVADVGGAIGAGMKAAWINRHGAALPDDGPQPHATLRSLDDVLSLL
jgi:putative hydrolase of the HAD superfamily